MRQIEPFDVVALVTGDGARHLPAGAEGTVLEILRDGALEVEFSDDEGRTLHVGHYEAADLQVVWSARTRAFVSEPRLITT